MSLSFHWFLPTYGDSRSLVAGGHGTFLCPAIAPRHCATSTQISAPAAEDTVSRPSSPRPAPGARTPG